MYSRDKDLVWFKGEVKTPPFSSEARIEAGFLLRRLQQGESLSMPQSRPMPNIGLDLNVMNCVLTMLIKHGELFIE